MFRCLRGEVAGIVAVGVTCFAVGLPASPRALAATARAAELGATRASERISIVLPLAADDQGLARLARAVTDPASPQYGRYEPFGELARRFGAAASVRRRVLSYLRRAGASAVRIDATGLFADATISAVRAERLFGTSLAQFSAGRRPQFTAPVAPVALPRELRGLAESVIGLDTEPLSLPHAYALRARASDVLSIPASASAVLGGRARGATQPSSALPRTGAPAGCPAGVSAGEQGGNPATAGFTPNQYLDAYGFTALHDQGITGQGERVALIEIDGFAPDDVRTFASCFGLGVPRLEGVGVGVRRPLPPGGEATLDIEVLDAAAPELHAIDVYETKASAANTLRALAAPLQRRRFRPAVISVSLGLCEPSVLRAIGVPGLITTEATLEMAAISGITFVASSGDQGSADCVGPDGLPVDRLAVNYPASSPWTAAIGGTNMLLSPSNQLADQLVWNDTSVQPGFAGGGGRSMLFRRPLYQRGTVTAHRRELPDVSLLADIIPGYAVFCTALGDCINSENTDPWQAVGGTSAGTPLLAGGFALVDEMLRRDRRQPLGLVNPLLYRIGRSAPGPQAFFDVRAYGNDVGPYIPGNGRPLGCCNARPGYDEASGWGSLNLASFAAQAAVLQPPQIHLYIPPHQHPLARRAIVATVSCAAACRLAAAAVVRIAGARRFVVVSRTFGLDTSGARRVLIDFSAGQLRRLRVAARRRRRATAIVFGVLVSPSGRIVSETPGKRVRIVR